MTTLKSISKALLINTVAKVATTSPLSEKEEALLQKFMLCKEHGKDTLREYNDNMKFAINEQIDSVKRGRKIGIDFEEAQGTAMMMTLDTIEKWIEKENEYEEEYEDERLSFIR